MAVDLSVSPKTVKKHLDNILKRLGIYVTPL
ncbi:MAG: LuxR C-terminal-related transcriptional regulator [Thermomicrobiales bacterium]